MKYRIATSLLMAMLFPVITLAAQATDIPDAGLTDAQVFEAKCMACHDLPHPERLDWQGWRNILYLMERRMDERGFEKPTNDEWQAIARYLRTHAR